MAQQVAFATGVPSNIYAFNRYTRNSTCLYHTQALKPNSFCGEPKLSFGLKPQTYEAAYVPFTPNKSG